MSDIKPRKHCVTQHFYDMWKHTHPDDDMSRFEVMPEYPTCVPAYRVRLREARNNFNKAAYDAFKPIVMPILNWLNKLLSK